MATNKQEKAKRVQDQLEGKMPFDPVDHQCREFYSMKELVKVLAVNTIVWCWAAEGWTKVNPYCLRFEVDGHHHNGYVFVVVNGADLFDIFYTDFNGMIKFYDKDIYLEDLISVIDKRVEYIDAYEDKD